MDILERSNMGKKSKGMLKLLICFLLCYGIYRWGIANDERLLMGAGIGAVLLITYAIGKGE